MHLKFLMQFLTKFSPQKCAIFDWFLLFTYYLRSIYTETDWIIDFASSMSSSKSQTNVSDLVIKGGLSLKLKENSVFASTPPLREIIFTTQAVLNNV